MPIQSDDIKLLQSAVMADVPEGGGGATGIEIIDGQSNNILPDTSTDDRAVAASSCAKFSAQVPYLLANPAALHAAVSADYARRWPDLIPPTLADCEAFCAGASLSSPITDTPTT